MAMNSMEEDALFALWGWEKDLIGRKFDAPVGGRYITFDQLMEATTSEEGESALIEIVRRYGVEPK